MLRRTLLLVAIVSLLAELSLLSPRIVHAVSIRGQGQKSITSQPYLYKTRDGGNGTIILSLMYDNYQNANFVVEPELSCVDKILVNGQLVNQGPVDWGPPYSPPFCYETVFNLAQYLQSGSNQISIEVSPQWGRAEVYFYPQLVGGDMLSGFAILGIAIAVMVLAYDLFRCGGFSVVPSVILVAGMMYFSLWLHYRSNVLYTNDLPGHLQHIHFMTHHWKHTYDYDGRERHHPPTYYFLAAAVFNLFGWFNFTSPLTGVRILSLILYMLFCIYGVRTLREAVAREGLTYYMGCLLLVFWPVSIIMATRINNDIALYPFWAAAFYYIAHWYRTQNLSALHKAIMMMGVAFMIKSNAIIPLLILSACVMQALFCKKTTWAQLCCRNSLGPLLILCLGIMVNASRFIYVQWFLHKDLAEIYFGGPGHHEPSLWHFISFDIAEFLQVPYIQFSHEPSFLNYFLKTMLYGEFTWHKGGSLPIIAGLLLLAFWLLTFIGIALWLYRNRWGRDGILPYLLGVGIPMAALVCFMISKHWDVTQDLRFIYPMLIPLVTLFTMGMENARNFRSTTPVYWLGLTTATGLILVGVLNYLGYYMVWNAD